MNVLRRIGSGRNLTEDNECHESPRRKMPRRKSLSCLRTRVKLVDASPSVDSLSTTTSTLPLNDVETKSPDNKAAKTANVHRILCSVKAPAMSPSMKSPTMSPGRKTRRMRIPVNISKEQVACIISNAKDEKFSLDDFFAQYDKIVDPDAIASDSKSTTGW